MTKLLFSLVVFVISGCVSSNSLDQAPSIYPDCPSGVAKGRYFTKLDMEAIPARYDTKNEIPFEEFRMKAGTIYKVTSCRSNDIPTEIYKYIDGNIDFGIEYIYEGESIVEMKVLYLDGESTVYQMLQEI